MKILESVLDAVVEVLQRIFWDRTALCDYDTFKMLQHPQDRANYYAALENLRNGSKTETFVLHTGKRVTLRTFH